MTHEDQSTVSVLEPNECWALVRSTTVGRLAVSIDGQPDIFPINYAVDHGTIVFRTAEGTKLSATAANRAVAFEVDGYEPDAELAWSVVIRGRAEQIRRTDELIDTASLPVLPWHGGRKERFIRVVTEQITGRRFHKVDPEVWRTPLTDAPRAAPE